jgi:hypothetical protein
MPFLTRGRIVSAALVTAVLSAIALPAQAADPLTFPAGTACSFELEVKIGSSDNRVDRTFTDADGNVVRMLAAGRGTPLTFRNVSTGAELTLRANGSVMRTTPNADGTSTVVSTGHNVIILFPTDSPAGPSTTLYTGRVTYLQTPEFVFTLIGSSGDTVDICAELE